MKAAVLVLAAFAALPVAAQPARPVGGIEVERFAGTWYEVARLHDSSQADCASDVTSHFLPLKDGSMRVTVSCRTLDGRTKTDIGEAHAQASDARHATRWKVSYLPHWLQWLPVRQDDLCVVMLDPQYRYAVTSDSAGRQLRVMARSPALPSASLGRIVDRLTADGYPTWQLVLTRQSAQPKAAGSPSPATVPARPPLIVHSGPFLPLT